MREETIAELTALKLSGVAFDNFELCVRNIGKLGFVFQQAHPDYEYCFICPCGHCPTKKEIFLGCFKRGNLLYRHGYVFYIDKNNKVVNNRRISNVLELLEAVVECEYAL